MTEPENAPKPHADAPPPAACPVCGGRIPPDAPAFDGKPACPRCLLGAGIPTGGGKPADAPSAAEVAARFPDYEILSLLGRGGMGVVWKARQKGLDRIVALKVLPAEVAGTAGFADRFQREARALARLTHPNIVGVHEFGERDGMFFLVLEYVDGVNIRQALRDGRISAHEVLRIVPQICDALQYAHEHGVVHRDIKPENVLIDREGRVRVADFGLAKIVLADGSSRDLTVTGQVMGTPHYMAPEQWERPTTVDHRADIYSLGVVFYEMLTGELPLGRFQPPSQMVRVDVRIDEVVLRSLEKAPERRWQHASDVKSEVGAIGATPAAAEMPEPVRAGDPDATPRTSRLAIGALGAMALAAGVVPFLAAYGQTSGVRGIALSAAALATVVLAAWIASAVSWARIHHSGGRLRGKWIAVTGTLLPLVLVCVAAPLFVLLSRAPARYSVASAIPVPAPAQGPSVGNTPPARRTVGAGRVVESPATPDTRPPRSVQGAVAELLARMPIRSVQSVLDLYATDAHAPLAALDDADAMRGGQTGELGFPLLFAGLPRRAGAMVRVTRSVLRARDAGGDVTSVTATDGRTVWTFTMRHELGVPCFTTDPVEVRSLGPSDPDFDPIVSGAAYEIAWDQLRRMWKAVLDAQGSTDLAKIGDLYSPATREDLSGIPDADRDERGARLQLGLPLAVNGPLGAPLASFELETLEVHAGSRTATVRARAKDGVHVLQFELTCRGVNRWYFAAEPVTTKALPPDTTPRFTTDGLDPEVAKGIDDLWLRCVKGVRGDDFGDLLALYLPEDRGVLRVLDPKDLPKLTDNPAGGCLGVPFWAMGHGKDSLDRFRLVAAVLSEVSGEPPRRLMKVAVVASDGERSLLFLLNGRIVEGRGVDRSRVEWTFARDDVNLVPGTK